MVEGRVIYEKTHDLPGMVCPFCEAKMDKVTGFTGDPNDSLVPCIGDLTVCLECGMLLEFTESALAFAAPSRMKDIIQEVSSAIEPARQLENDGK